MGWSDSIHVKKMPHCRESHVGAHLIISPQGRVDYRRKEMTIFLKDPIIPIELISTVALHKLLTCMLRK